MRALTAALLVALIAVLSVIAYDLHQVARTMGAVTGVGPYAVQLTREQRTKMLQQSTTDALADFDAIVSAPEPAKRQAAKKPSK